MDYTITNLTQVADCDFLINTAMNEKADLDVKRSIDERGVQKFTGNAIALDAEYQRVLSELAQAEAALQALPPGRDQILKDREVTRLKYRKSVLETRKENYGALALLEKQKDLSIVQLQIGEIEAFIDAVKARKDQLAA